MTMTDEPNVAIYEPVVTDVSSVPAPVDDELGQRLLAAAAEVFAERGYDKAGVAEIARRAGVTTGAIYARYPGKAELLVEAIDPHATDELETLFADHHFQGRMEDILLAAGTNLVQPAQSDAGVSALLLESFVAARRHDDVGRVMRNRVLERQDRLTEIVEVAKTQGGIDQSFDTESLVLFCHALGFGFLLIDAIGLEKPDSQHWQHLIANLVAALGEAPTRTNPQPPQHQGETPS